jgi:hypothetical protein
VNICLFVFRRPSGTRDLILGCQKIFFFGFF